jgi:hypothetical protein
VTKADAPFPSGTSEDEWRLTRSRQADDVNAEVREAVDQNDYLLFRIGLFAHGNSEALGTSPAPLRCSRDKEISRRGRWEKEFCFGWSACRFR